jgi:hypothetical protein
MNWAYAWLWLLLSTGCTAHLEKRVSLIETQVAELRARLPSGKFSEGDPRNRTTYEESSGFAGFGTGEPHSPMLATRGGTGTYSLYASPVVSGTTISSTYWNNTLADLATEITDSLSRSGKGGMLAPLALTVGSVTAPSIYFSGDTNTGIYTTFADDLAITAGGVKAIEFGATGVVNTTTNGVAITATGNGTGNAITAIGGSSNGDAIAATGTGTGAGIRGTGGASGSGVVATAGATTGIGLVLQVGNTVLPPFRFGTSIAPTGAAIIGDMYMTTAGVLKVCVTAGTPCAAWTTVGVQTP